MAITNTTLTTAPQSLLSAVPTGSSYALTVLMCCNTATPDANDPDLNADNLTIYVINNANAGSAGTSNMIINNVKIRAGETFTLDTEKVILEENDTLAAKSSTGTNLSVMVSYVEI